METTSIVSAPTPADVILCPECGIGTYFDECTDDGLCIGCAISKYGHVLYPCVDCGASVKVYDVETINEGTVCCEGGCEG